MDDVNSQSDSNFCFTEINLFGVKTIGQCHLDNIDWIYKLLSVQDLQLGTGPRGVKIDDLSCIEQLKNKNIWIQDHDILVKFLTKMQKSCICLNVDLDFEENFKDYISPIWMHQYINDELISRIINRQKQCIENNIPSDLICICNVNSVQDLYSFQRLIKDGNLANITNIFLLDRYLF